MTELVRNYVQEGSRTGNCWRLDTIGACRPPYPSFLTSCCPASYLQRKSTERGQPTLKTENFGMRHRKKSQIHQLTGKCPLLKDGGESFAIAANAWNPPGGPKLRTKAKEIQRLLRA